MRFLAPYLIELFYSQARLFDKIRVYGPNRSLQPWIHSTLWPDQQLACSVARTSDS